MHVFPVQTLGTIPINGVVNIMVDQLVTVDMACMDRLVVRLVVTAVGLVMGQAMAHLGTQLVATKQLKATTIHSNNNRVMGSMQLGEYCWDLEMMLCPLVTNSN